VNTIRNTTLKLLIATTAFTAVIASPALARVHDNVPTQAQAQSDFFGITPLHAPAGTNPANAVYGPGGHYWGSDPSGYVRLEMSKDNTAK
jgi:hypothetical protein